MSYELLAEGGYFKLELRTISGSVPSKSPTVTNGLRTRNYELSLVCISAKNSCMANRL